jgi:tyrosyl-tRNA synthetase
MTFDLIKQGTAGIFPEDELKKKLASGKQLKIKFGIDPTSPDIHLGHCVALRKLQQFQDLGHEIFLVIGDHTACIGDPTGRDNTRPKLTKEEAKVNAKTYLEQAGKILDTSRNKLHVDYNSTWLDSAWVLNCMLSDFTVQQLLHRNDFKKRIKDGNPISMMELLYPTFQAYDSIIIKPDVEIGGTDQTFNMQLARDYQVKCKQKQPQTVITMPLLVGLDGKEKMSKSKGNHIGVMDEPNDMFGKLMSIPDHLTTSYLELLTGDTRPIIKDPLGRKEAMAHDIVCMLYGIELAVSAHNEFIRVVRNKELPSELEIKHIGLKWNKLSDIMVSVGFAPSKTQARKLIESGAVRLNGVKLLDPTVEIQMEKEREEILQVGKRRICIIRE